MKKRYLKVNMIERKRIKAITLIDLYIFFALFRPTFSPASLELITFSRILLSSHFYC